ncbi:MAG: surface-adhesin E family protein [Pseudomonadota bacterium]
MISYIILAAAVSSSAADTRSWLTITGDVGNSSVNTIQVNPAPVEARGQFKTLQVRVSRSVQRTSWDGVPYRSYESTVVFDCSQRTARYERIDYYAQPFWAGKPSRSANYIKGEPRLMQFRDVEPNPNVRIIAAACAPSIGAVNP